LAHFTYILTAERWLDVAVVLDLHPQLNKRPVYQLRANRISEYKLRAHSINMEWPQK
jgi:DTW domain-containing protein YfiP